MAAVPFVHVDNGKARLKVRLDGGEHGEQALALVTIEPDQCLLADLGP
jgi:hypothetical protein